MKIGLIARADDRGIGTQSLEFFRHVKPERTLVVREPGSERMGFAPHLDRFPGAMVEECQPGARLGLRAVREFLFGLDVVYAVETVYDPRLYEVAREMSVAVVVHANPEFWAWSSEDEPRPTAWWLPTTWRQDLLPEECRVVPFPCPDPPEVERGPTCLHVAGHRAAYDRNGTDVFLRALRRLRFPLSARVDCQDRRLPTQPMPRRVHLERRVGGVPDRWDLYRGASMLVLPRRYGGLCLPVLEALSLGMTVVMTDVEPQRSTWPIVPIPARMGVEVRTVGAMLHLAESTPHDLAFIIDDLSTRPGALEMNRQHNLQWAADHGWEASLPLIMAELERACDR